VSNTADRQRRQPRPGGDGYPATLTQALRAVATALERDCEGLRAEIVLFPCGGRPEPTQPADACLVTRIASGAGRVLGTLALFG